jgi:hypothetical protein
MEMELAAVRAKYGFVTSTAGNKKKTSVEAVAVSDEEDEEGTTGRRLKHKGGKRDGSSRAQKGKGKRRQSSPDDDVEMEEASESEVEDDHEILAASMQTISAAVQVGAVMETAQLVSLCTYDMAITPEPLRLYMGMGVDAWVPAQGLNNVVLAGWAAKDFYLSLNKHR